MNQAFIDKIRTIIGARYLLTDRESLACYQYDSTPELEALPGAVALPGSPEEVRRIMQVCYEAGIPVIPRGSGTNLSGGSLASGGGIVLQTSRMNRVLEIDEENLTATVEPGVITSALHREVEFPPWVGMWLKIRAGSAA
jgi:glycolate oxidase